MISRLLATTLVFATFATGKVKTKSYAKPSSCVNTYHLERGRVLTSRGLVEDPTVNSIMKDAIAGQMKQLKITEADKSAGLIVRFMGGVGAGLQMDDLMMGDVAMWSIGGPVAVPGRTYKTSTLVIGVVDGKSNQTLWAARCDENFGDPSQLQARIQKAVSKAFEKFPKKIACN
jgi:uncharacterized protein DUF4136